MKITWIFITTIYWLYAIDNPIKNIKVINPNTPYEATIKIEENTTFLYFNHKKQKISENEYSHYDTSYKIDDFNFDGIDDIAILSGVGYGGVNYFYEIYLAQNNRYQDSGINLSNYELFPQFTTILSEYKSGPRHFREFYDVNERGMLHRFAKVYEFDDNICKILDWSREDGMNIAIPRITFCDELISNYRVTPVYAEVVSSKALLYNKPEEKSSGMYLIKGDIVKVIDENFLVEYHGKRKIRKYINSNDLEMLRSHTYIHNHTVGIWNPDKKDWDKTNISDILQLQKIGKNRYAYNIETYGTNADECSLSGIVKKQDDMLVAYKEHNCTLQFDIDKTIITIADIKNRCKESNCGHHGYFDGISFELFLDD